MRSCAWTANAGRSEPASAFPSAGTAHWAGRVAVVCAHNGEVTTTSGTGAPPLGGRAGYPRILATACVVLVLDQITKQIALERLAQGPVELFPGMLTLRLTFNSGGAFGLLQGLPWLFLIFTLVVAAAILLWAPRVTDRRWQVPLGMLLGGGLGNAWDRVFRGFEGQVVDFVDLHVWPVFNLADSSITLAVVMILLLGARAQEPESGTDLEAAPGRPVR
jgi:signal peptidase II